MASKHTFRSHRSCSVCQEDYAFRGAHVPRVLPCKHIICTSCIEQFIRRSFTSTLRCPECQECHQAPSGGSQAFPMSRYIVWVLEQKPNPKRRRSGDSHQHQGHSSRRRRLNSGTQHQSQDVSDTLQPIGTGPPECLPAGMKVKVMQMVDTGYKQCFAPHLAVLGTSAVLCGLRAWQWSLKSFNPRDDEPSPEVDVQGQVSSITEAQLEGVPVIALSLRKHIVFHDADDFSKRLYSEDVSHNVPECLRYVSPTTLLYVNLSRDRPVHRVDTGETPVRHSGVHNIPLADHQGDLYKKDSHYIEDMCTVLTGGRHLLIIVHFAGIKAVDLRTNEVVWYTVANEDFLPEHMEMDMNARGVTTDGRRVYVTDEDNCCVQMFSVCDGRYLGYMLNLPHEIAGRPILVRWMEESDTLAVVHQHEQGWFLTFVGVQNQQPQLQQDVTV